MARSRQALQQAIEEILIRNGEDGRRMSLRQAERRTGLSPATIGELAKGNARTPETLRRFAAGFGEDTTRLLLLGGYVPGEALTSESNGDERSGSGFEMPSYAAPARQNDENGIQKPVQGEEHFDGIAPDAREWLERFGRALAKMPPSRERELWKDSLRRNTELIEAFLERLIQADVGRNRTYSLDQQTANYDAEDLT